MKRTQAPSETASGPGQVKIKQLKPLELKAMLDQGIAFELIDVRTARERTIAQLSRARLLDQQTLEYLLGLDRGTRLVFHCHHGIRSQSAAEYFVQQGFNDVSNLQGGIDAWSAEVDPSVPRY